MYLIIDRDYRISKSEVLSGRLRTDAKRGELSVVNLKTMQGINIDGSWSDIQYEPGSLCTCDPQANDGCSSPGCVGGSAM